LLGDGAFNEFTVDIDFAHHRIAFRDPASQVKPDGAVEVPLIPVEDLHLVPVSIEGAPPAQFELGLGNSGEILVYQPYYESHKLLEGRQLSKRLAAGTGGFVVEPVATLNHAEFAGVTFVNMPAALDPLQLGRNHVSRNRGRSWSAGTHALSFDSRLLSRTALRGALS
jgi:hypothetical protein